MPKIEKDTPIAKKYAPKCQKRPKMWKLSKMPKIANKKKLQKSPKIKKCSKLQKPHKIAKKTPQIGNNAQDCRKHQKLQKFNFNLSYLFS